MTPHRPMLYERQARIDFQPGGGCGGGVLGGGGRGGGGWVRDGSARPLN